MTEAARARGVVVEGRAPEGRGSSRLLRVRVTPRGGRDAVLGWDGDVLRVRVRAAPAGGEANAAVVALLARALGLPRGAIEIIRGASSREKWIRVGDLDPARLRERLAAGRGAR